MTVAGILYFKKKDFLKIEDTADYVRGEGEEQFIKTGTEKQTDLCHKRQAAASWFFFSSFHWTLHNISNNMNVFPHISLNMWGFSFLSDEKF